MRAVSVLTLLLALPAPARAQCECPAEGTRVIGHRGAGVAGEDMDPVENTIASAQQAFLEGAGMVEIDVQLSADGALVLMHDDTIDRTTSGTGCVSATSAAALEALGVPTLATFLAAVDGPLDVEVKLHESDACPAQDLDALAEAVATTLAPELVARELLVTSFDLGVLRAIRAREAGIPIGYLSTDAADVEVAASEGFEAIVLLLAVAPERTLRRAREAGLGTYVWTVNGADALREVLARDVDGVITDTVPEAVTAIGEVCAAHVCVDAAGAPDAGTDAGSGGGCSAAPSPAAPRTLTWALALLALALARRRTRSRNSTIR